MSAAIERIRCCNEPPVGKQGVTDLAVMEERIRLVIVDDHPMMRSGIKAILATARTIEVVGEASSGEEAVSLCKTLQPNVVLMDLIMPGMGGVAATRAVRSACPETRVIVLTSFDDGTLVQDAIRAGAMSFLLKNVSGTVLTDAVVAATKGQPTMANEALHALMDIAANLPPLGSDLTDREREVLQFLVKGLTNAQIAHQMSISEATVRFHVGNILSKLEVSNRTEAVSVAIKQRLID